MCSFSVDRTPVSNFLLIPCFLAHPSVLKTLLKAIWSSSLSQINILYCVIYLISFFPNSERQKSGFIPLYAYVQCFHDEFLHQLSFFSPPIHVHNTLVKCHLSTNTWIVPNSIACSLTCKSLIMPIQCYFGYSFVIDSKPGRSFLLLC